MGFIEQLGTFCTAVDNDLACGLLGSELGSEQFRVMKILAKLFGFEQVDPQGVRIGTSQQCGFTCLAWPPKKKGLRAGLRELK